MHELTERQRREREFYDEYAHRRSDEVVDFSPVLGEEQRPWNPYWYVYQSAVNFFSSPEQKLLDFGCGWGSRSIVFAKIGYHVTGFDICEQNILECERRATELGFGDRTHFAVEVAEHLSFENDSFDIITGIDVLHHVDVDQAIKEAYRVLKPGGMALFREYVEVPIYDTLRNSRLILSLFPNGKSLDEHRTEDEHKLSSSQMRAILRTFPNHQIQRFCLVSRLHRLWPIRHPHKPSRLEMVDRHLFRWLPPIRPLGGEVVLVLRK